MDVVSTLGVDQRQQPPSNHRQGKVHPALLTLAAAVVSAFLGIIVDQASVFEVKPVLLKVRLPLCLIPN